jgi:hypothetical protein
VSSEGRIAMLCPTRRTISVAGTPAFRRHLVQRSDLRYRRQRLRG